MPIEAIRLRRFRGFQEVYLPLAPLTVLLGPNSAGKSCFGHAIVGLAQAQRNAGSSPLDLSEPPGATLGNWPVDLGRFGDLRTTGQEGPIGVTITTHCGDVELEFGGIEQVSELGVTRIHYLDKTPGLDERTGASLGTQTVATGVSDNGPMTVGPNQSQFANDFRRKGEAAWAVGDQSIDLVANGLSVKAAWLATTRSAVSFPDAAGSFLAGFLRSVRYLRATRISPQREYRRGHPKDLVDVGPAGELTAEYLASNQSKIVEVYQPPGLVSSTEDALALLDSEWPIARLPLLDAVGLWLRHMGLANSVTAKFVLGGTHTRLDAAIRPGGHARPLTDLGFGLSQTIPVLVAGLELKKDDLLVVELPESQLHPVPQALLADFFCSVVKSGARVLVETHSEPLFHRLRVRAAFDRDLASKIGAWFLDSADLGSGLCSSPRPVDLDDEFNWPEGFLSQGYAEEIALRAARSARRRQSTGAQ